MILNDNNLYQFFIAANVSIVTVYCATNVWCTQIKLARRLLVCHFVTHSKEKVVKVFFTLANFLFLLRFKSNKSTTAAAGSLRYGVDVYCMHITIRIYQFYCHGSLSRLLNYISTVLQWFSSIFEVVSKAHIWIYMPYMDERSHHDEATEKNCKHIYRFCLDY